MGDASDARRLQVRDDPYLPIDQQMLLEPGDHIRVNRGLYAHHGIVIGLAGLGMWRDLTGERIDARRRRLSRYPVVHYAEGKGSGHLALTSLERFLGDSKQVEVLFHEATGHLPKRETVHRAMAHVGMGNYSLFRHNCEHFSTWCRTGHWTSQQIAGYGTLASAVTCLFGGFTLALIPLGIAATWSHRNPPTGPCARCAQSHDWSPPANGNRQAIERVLGRLGKHDRREDILDKRRNRIESYTLYCPTHPDVRLTEVASKSTTAWCSQCHKQLTQKRAPDRFAKPRTPPGPRERQQ